MLQQHNLAIPVTAHADCIRALEALLDSITGTKYVFLDFAPERWATGGRAAQFVPFQSRMRKAAEKVIIVIDESCEIEGLVWPE
ncbi:MAG: hypothetical protein GF418_00395 [Chitinivibrionales bacterium]|nr:hypothetical protein [Chitinivibrionales bacterium]MBD3394059.1 hypothetical protein [Chitinivibrionales bacterium]